MPITPLTLMGSSHKPPQPKSAILPAVFSDTKDAQVKPPSEQKAPPQPAASSDLERWLEWLEFLHPSEIDLGLQRVASVARQASLLQRLPRLITVAGTNGKGSTVALLSAIYRAAGYRVGTYTSPHIVEFNERICVDGQMMSDSAIVSALSWIEAHRKGVRLTYFEYSTLAAMRLFMLQQCDVVVLEVGLGGRLDAVNVWDTDCALITSIALDHESWLGSDLEIIGLEKAGIARADRPLVVGLTKPPISIARHASSIGAILSQAGTDFRYTKLAQRWQIEIGQQRLDLPLPSLAGEHQLDNAATAIAGVYALQRQLPVDARAIEQGLLDAALVGRFERRQHDGVEIVIDVAHNPAAAAALSQTLQQLMPARRAQMVFAIMADKNIDTVLATLAPHVAAWHCGQLEVPRALATPALEARLLSLAESTEAHWSVHSYATVVAAFTHAVAEARQSETDYVLVSGSFFTVTEVASCLN